MVAILLHLLQMLLVSSAAIIWVVTQCFSPTSRGEALRDMGEKRCVTTQITAAEDTKMLLDYFDSSSNTLDWKPH